MRELLTLLVPLLGAALASPIASGEPRTWDYRNGRWEELGGATAATQPVADETLDRVEKLIADNQTKAAKKLAVLWIKTNPKSPIRDRAVYLLGQANFRYGDRLAAFYNFDELLDLYPESRYFSAALQRQFDIADAFLNGYKRRFLRLPLLDAEDEGIEMLYRIQQRSPGSQLAEKCLLRTADYYYRRAQFDFAADAYGFFIRSYKRSPEVPRARLREAFANYAQFRGVRFDPIPVIDARRQLVAIAAEYPNLAREENLDPVIARIDETLARKVFVTGDYYQRTHHLEAAVYHFRFLVKTYPDAPDVAEARKRLEKMPAWALKAEEPPAGDGYSPATQPSAEAR